MHVDNEARRRLNLPQESTLLHNLTAAFMAGLCVGAILGAVYLNAVGAL